MKQIGIRQMLAKVQKPDRAAHFRDSLQLPEQSSLLQSAEIGLTIASKARVFAAQDLENAQIRMGVEGSLKRSPTVTLEQIQVLKDTLTSLVKDEDIARAERDVLHKQHVETARATLSEPIGQYLHLVARKSAELEELLSIGAALSNQANRNQIGLNQPNLKSISQMQQAYLSPMLKLIGAWR